MVGSRACYTTVIYYYHVIRVQVSTKIAHAQSLSTFILLPFRLEEQYRDAGRYVVGSPVFKGGDGCEESVAIASSCGGRSEVRTSVKTDLETDPLESKRDLLTLHT